MVAEKKKMEPPEESRGISKKKWLEERKKKIGRLLDANGLDMAKAYMLDTQEMATKKYKKWEKDPAPAGWDGKNLQVFSQFYPHMSNSTLVCCRKPLLYIMIHLIFASNFLFDKGSLMDLL